MFVKKMLLIGSLSLISVFSYAEKVEVKYEFLQALAQVGKDSNNFQRTTINGNLGYKFLYTPETEIEFGQFGVINYESGGYISLAPQGELDAGLEYQCVGLVKSISNLEGLGTSTWKVDMQITPFTMPNKGDIIATFGSNGKYNHGHVGAVISVHSDGVYVIDQNSDGTGSNPVGKIYIRKIIFGGSGYWTNDLSKYSVVKI